MLKKLTRFVLFSPLIAVVLIAVWWLAQPWPLRLRWHDPERTSFMRYREKEARRADETIEIQHEWVALTEIARPMQRAVILAEDGNFYDHGGVDWGALGDELEYDGEPPFSFFDPADLKAVWSALWYYGKNRDEVRGRSTITQQLAKNLYFTPERSLTRKFAELVVAQRLEWFLSKDRILEIYLNTVELGPGVFGVGSAAEVYFDRTAKNLSAYQAASLAGTLPHPLTSNPKLKPSRMAWRRDLILGRMSRTSADATPIPVAPELPAIELPPVDITPIDAGGGAPPDSPAGGSAPPAPDSAVPPATPAPTATPPGAPPRPDTTGVQPQP